MSFITLFLTLVPMNNWVMSLVKFLGGESLSVTWLRGFLVALSFIGIVAYSALSGKPVDFNQVSALGGLLLEVLGVSLASHVSYRVIKKA